MIKLEKSRLPLFHQIFAQVGAGNEKFARETLSINEKTKSLAKASMPVLQQEIHKMKNPGKAKNVYQTIQGLKSDDG